ncbi:n-terminal domain containing protein [Stylonychia lemnae]|uniref:N-terminal domain containing protein n=1 Tax=Stylonychia lemnae TaxID=5949 RepID=A0A077ZTJ2_STYLE|nr:n-terminal domain containing protein [Stylonychia lemnae]|eukprot:CDW72824.1 n-terminal domain containing protein [Stylonychia lemnae]
MIKSLKKRDSSHDVKLLQSRFQKLKVIDATNQQKHKNHQEISQIRGDSQIENLQPNKQHLKSQGNSRYNPSNRGSNCGSIEHQTIDVKRHSIGRGRITTHSRMVSQDFSKKSTKHSTITTSSADKNRGSIASFGARSRPNSQKRSILCQDYIEVVSSHLKKTERKHKISHQHLKNHKITGVYRAKMVDWMVEVLTAFKCSDQTFFLATNIMDRYFNRLNELCEIDSLSNHSIELPELHITGVVCMFMASKFEDIFPLLMKTVVKKIGHDKITDEQIRTKEQDIFKAIDFNLGAMPTIHEFLNTYIHQVFEEHEEKDFISKMSVYLGKMCLHHEKLCYKKSSQLASSCIYVALKICEQMRKKTIFTTQILADLLSTSGVEEEKLIRLSKKVLYLAQNFEKELPGLFNLREIYIPQLNQFVQAKE